MQDAELTAWIGGAPDELAEIAATAGSRSAVPACPGRTMRREPEREHLIASPRGTHRHGDHTSSACCSKKAHESAVASSSEVM